MSTLENMGLINDYTIAWCVYLLASVGIFMVVWRLSRSWPALLRHALRFLFACIILVPVAVVPGEDALAPAFIVAIFEIAAGNADGAVTALSALALAVVLALLVYACWLACKYLFKKMRARNATTAAPQKTGRARAPAA